MNPLGLLMRMKRLVQNPPSWGRVLLGLAVIGAVLAVAGAEALDLWPEGWTTSRARPPVVN